MSIHRRVFRGGLTLGFNQGLTQACSFLRNVIVARILSPTDFGIAAIFSFTFSLLDMMSNLSADKLLVQAADGNEPGLQKSAQALQATRGVMNAVIIFMLGGPIVRLFGVPQAAWAFHALALVPLLRGFTHLDLSRMQREMKFGPQVVSDSGSALLVTLAAIPLGFWFRDYSLMLWLLIVQSAASLVLSHLVAERRCGWAWERKYVKRMVAFGWPLLINGALMYIIFEGDRFIIGASHRLFARSAYTLADLGIYSVAFGLTMAPNMLVCNVSNSLFLPLLSRVQDKTIEFHKWYAGCAELVAAVATLMAVGFIVAGGSFVALIYGHKYAGAGAFIGWLGAMWALRALRQAPTLAALSLGDTRNLMVSNVARTAALGGVLFAGATGQPIVWIAISGFLGEVLALAVCLWRLQKEHEVATSTVFRPFAVCAAGMLLATLDNAVGVGQTTLLGSFVSAGTLALAMLLVMLLLFPRLRNGVRLLIEKTECVPLAPVEPATE
jgi:O-antigen/teichoic acid export membrane protein